MNRTLSIIALAAFAVVGQSTRTASAAIVINEVFVNPPGTDNGQEFIEFRSTTGGTESLAGLSLLIVEGDGTGAGVIDAVLSLNSLSTGSNGLLLWRDASSVVDTSSAAGVQGPAVATTVTVADFNPDVENGSNTYLLVSGFTGALASDLDTNDDGVLDSSPWTSIVDSLGLVENDGSANVTYAGAANTFGPNAGFNADLLARVFDTKNGVYALFGSDVLGTNPGGPYTVDPTRYALADGSIPTLLVPEGAATPGVDNFTVPEPATLGLIALGSAGLLGSRIRRSKSR